MVVMKNANKSGCRDSDAESGRNELSPLYSRVAFELPSRNRRDRPTRPTRLMRPVMPRLRVPMRWAMAPFYLAAGTVHLAAQRAVVSSLACPSNGECIGQTGSGDCANPAPTYWSSAGCGLPSEVSNVRCPPRASGVWPPCSLARSRGSFAFLVVSADLIMGSEIRTPPAVAYDVVLMRIVEPDAKATFA
jgi:hypothetical protein